MASADGLDAGADTRRAAGRMVGRDEADLLALKLAIYFFHSAPMGNSKAASDAGSISMLKPGAVGAM